MTHATTEQLEQAWNLLQSLVPVSVIRTEHQYDEALETLHQLLDTVGDDESHPLYDMLDTLGILIHSYEETHAPSGNATGVDVLKLLMDEHQLSEADLPELGSPTLVAEILAGRRALSVPQAQALAKRFGVLPATFA